MQIIIPPPIRILSSEAYEYLLHFPPSPSMRRAVSFEKRQSTHASSRIRGIYILIATGEREGKEKKRGGSAHPREKKGRSPSSLVRYEYYVPGLSRKTMFQKMRETVCVHSPRWKIWERHRGGENVFFEIRIVMHIISIICATKLKIIYLHRRYLDTLNVWILVITPPVSNIVNKNCRSRVLVSKLLI